MKRARTFRSRKRDYSTPVTMVRCAAALALSIAALPSIALASQGNRYVGILAAEALPEDLPAFLHDKTTIADLGDYAREPDRMRGAGTMFDATHDADHFMALDGAGRTRIGTPLSALPATREAYMAALAKAGTSTVAEGVVLYTTAETFEQLREQFAYWRVTAVATRSWRYPTRKAWLKGEIRRREALILMTIGNLAHFAGDVAAPLHVSIHRNGWVGAADKGYTTQPFRRYVEGEFILRYVSQSAVKKAMPAAAPCAEPVMACLARAAEAALTHVEPFYRLATKNAFTPGNAQGVAFMAARTAEQAGLTRDLIVKAWRDSANETIGYTAGTLNVREVEAGKVPTFEQLHGWD